jgi:DNA-binding response OmpR family regulator
MKRILVIDDDVSILEALNMTLQDAGYDTETSTKNGEYVERSLMRQLPDLIVLDILLSGHDGRTICKNLKSQEATKNIPIILISAHPDAAKTAFEAGADDFLEKPFNIDDLLARVERLIGIV